MIFVSWKELSLHISYLLSFFCLSCDAQLSFRRRQFVYLIRLFADLISYSFVQI